MKKVTKYLNIIAAAVFACNAITTSAQDTIETSLKTDFVSQYIWRGNDLGHVSVQPELGLSWKGLSIGAWGSVGLSNADDSRELDFTLAYETGNLSLGIVDYWSDCDDSRYFYYKVPGTGHSFEGFVGYDFGPLAVSWQTVFAGSDHRESNDKRTYSSYFELTAPFQLASCEWQAAVGLVPWEAAYYDTSGFAVTNLSLRATKDIKVTDTFSLPLFGELVANPHSQHFYFVAGITLRVL